MSSQNYIRTNFTIAWPLALNALLMQSMLMIDIWLVSPLGEKPLAAMGIATTIVAFILGIQMALANGSQLVLSRAVGSGRPQALSSAVSSGMLINFAVALLFWTLLSLFEAPLLAMIIQDSQLQAEISDYLSISKYLVLFTAITQILIALFNSMGRSKVPFKGYLIELPINAALSYVLINGISSNGMIAFQGLGVSGAALGSVIAIAIRMVYLGWNVRQEPMFRGHGALFTAPTRTNLRKHFIEVFPVAANVTILSIGATAYQLLYSQLSLHSYVAITIIFPWIRAGTQFITAWAHSTAITISQAIGSRKTDGMVKNIDTSIDVAVWASFACAVCFAGLHFVLADIYPELDPATYDALSIIAPLYIFLPLVRGYNTVHGHVLRALGKTTAVFKINFTGQWLISIPLCAFIILGLDGSIFWAFAVQPIEEMVKALPFRMLARRSLAEFDSKQIDKLMFDK